MEEIVIEPYLPISTVSDMEIIVVSWERKRQLKQKIRMKKKQLVADLIHQIANVDTDYRHLNGKFILKTGDVRLGDKNAPLNKKLIELFPDYSDENRPRIKVITPDKYPAAGNRTHSENLIYQVDFLLKFGKTPPVNLHTKCIFNGKRLGRGEDKSNELNNHPNNLVLMTTPYGEYLANIYFGYMLLSGKTNTQEPVIVPKIAIQFPDHPNFVIPKVTQNFAFLHRCIQSFNDIPAKNRESKLYKMDLKKQEGFFQMMDRVTSSTPKPEVTS